MRRVAILGMVQNPPRCEKIEDLGKALSDWLERKRQYEDFTDEDGRPCRVSSDSLMAAMYKIMPKSLEETVMFKSDEFESFDSLFDRLISYSGKKHSLLLRDAGPKKQKGPDDMDIGAFGGQGKGTDRNANIQCWVCYGYGHYGKECPHKGKGKGNGQNKGLGKGQDKGKGKGQDWYKGANKGSGKGQAKGGKGKGSGGKGKWGGFNSFGGE